MKQLLAILLVLSLVVSPSRARPPYKKALADLFNLPASSRLNDCSTCHLPESNDERPHNVFGARVRSARSELRKANKPYDVSDRLLAIRGEDADGDGVSNAIELLANSAPGDATDKPSSEAIVRAKERLNELLAARNGYRWKPFERVEQPPIPTPLDRTWAKNPIDRFLRAEQEKHGLSPRPEAPPHVLLRRAYLDLTGLPPTVEEVRAFLNDGRPDAYERLVDRLLASPRYGERWGRHWMDVWRYSDWAGWGMQVRDSQPHVWHWRDWIIESLNADRPYDRMIQEMLAADELAPQNTSALRATGFLVRNFKLLSREKWLQDTVDHSAMAFLGVTLGCAKCHDHAYDPITQKEYYQVRAIFTPHHVRTDRLPGWRDVKQNGLPRVYDKDLDAKTFLFKRGDDRMPDKTPLEPAVPEALGGKFEIQPISLPKDAFDPERREFIAREELAHHEQIVEQKRETLLKALNKFRPSLPLEPNPLSLVGHVAAVRHTQSKFVLAQLEVDLAEAKLAHLRAMIRVEGLSRSHVDWQSAAKEATRAERRLALYEATKALYQSDPKKAKAPLAALAKAEQDAKLPDSVNFKPRPLPTYPTTSTGRRLAYARWIAHRDTPLAARVAVNHVWQRHFGRGIVPGMFDFGKNGQPPSHPALLDWLSVEFMERGWSMKWLHQIIVTSAAYRQDSTPHLSNLERDADNVYLWRFSPRRVEAEVVRDSLYFVADDLDSTMGGPDLPHERGLTVPRRSVYFQHAQEKQMEFLQIFDVASVTECYARKQAVLPQQALALINSDLVLSKSQVVAQQLRGDDSVFVRAAFERILSRYPTPEETSTCVEFLRGRGLRGRENLVHVLYNHHEFATLR